MRENTRQSVGSLTLQREDHMGLLTEGCTR